MADKVTPRGGDVMIAVDPQNDFCPEGALAVPHGNEVIPIINRIAGAFSRVVVTQDWHPPGHTSFASSHPGRQPFETIEVSYGPQILWPDHCIQGSDGAKFHGDLDLPQAQLIIRKGFDPEIDSYSAFFENDRRTPTGLTGYLRTRGLERAFLCGLATDYCVYYSAMDAVREGFEAVIVEDACRAIDLDGSLAKAMSDMVEAGVGFITSDRIAA